MDVEDLQLYATELYPLSILGYPLEMYHDTLGKNFCFYWRKICNTNLPITGEHTTRNDFEDGDFNDI